MPFNLNDIVVTKTGRIGSITRFNYLHDKQNVLLRFLDDLDLDEVPEKDVVLCYDVGAIAIAKVKGYESLTNGHSLDDLVSYLECRDLNFILENYHAAVMDQVAVYHRCTELLEKIRLDHLDMPQEIVVEIKKIRACSGVTGGDPEEFEYIGMVKGENHE